MQATGSTSTGSTPAGSTPSGSTPSGAAPAEYDVDRLVADLRRQLSGEVRADTASRAMYAVDASNYRVVPELVVRPRTAAELAEAAAICRSHGAPIVVRGAGTSMAGNAVGGVVLDGSRHLNRILDLDPVTKTAIVEPGVVLSHLNRAAGAHGLLFGVDPSSATRATLGGMIGNNACGALSVAYGTTADNVEGLSVALADGTLMDLAATYTPEQQLALRAAPGRVGALHEGLQGLAEAQRLLIERRFSPMRRRISGYALDRLLPENGYQLARFLCGSEGTLALTTAATLRLVDRVDHKVLLVLGFPDSFSAAEVVPVVLPFGPLTMESINSSLVDRLPEQVRAEATRAGLPVGKTWLLIDLPGDTPAAAEALGRRVEEAVRDACAGATATVVPDPAAQDVLWRCRRDGTGLATRRADGAEAWGGWEDAAVPPQRLGAYLLGLDELLGRYQLSGASYGHFGEGCMHMRIDFDLLTEAGASQYRRFVEEATELVVSLGGSVSGEHGDGRARSELLSRMYGAEGMAAFASVKDLWDPDGRLNPGIIARPLPLDRSLRHLGPAKDRELLTVFSYPHDVGRFAQAQRRCVGVGKCLQTSGGVMCPSYRATREESASTRGRAHLLWEMLEGEVITDRWKSREVRDALDLCLSCKGCLSDCPVNVDMATYKAEFQHHYYRRRLRPRSHYSMGWLPLWAALASRAPRLANAVAQSPAAGLLKRLGGVAAERELPTFATTTLVRRLRRRSERRAAGGAARFAAGRVVLWPDTFTNHLTPEVGVAAARVLEAAGFEVILLGGRVCCGLTWVSTGQLGTAKRVLRHTLKVLAPVLEEGLPVVVLEPSCAALFRHELTDLFPEDRAAARLRDAVRTLAEFLAEFAPDWQPPATGPRKQGAPEEGAPDRQALVQQHCHQYAVMGFEPDRRLLGSAGISARLIDQGCCGLAGNFGFEDGHYEVSMAVAEDGVLPAVRAAAEGTRVVADGFSCRTQIEHGTGRRALHLAELLAETLPETLPEALSETLPEDGPG